MSPGGNYYKSFNDQLIIFIFYVIYVCLYVLYITFIEGLSSKVAILYHKAFLCYVICVKIIDFEECEINDSCFAYNEIYLSMFTHIIWQYVQ